LWFSFFSFFPILLRSLYRLSLRLQPLFFRCGPPHDRTGPPSLLSRHTAVLSPLQMELVCSPSSLSVDLEAHPFQSTFRWGPLFSQVYFLNYHFLFLRDFFLSFLSCRLLFSLFRSFVVPSSVCGSFFFVKYFLCFFLARATLTMLIVLSHAFRRLRVQLGSLFFLCWRTLLLQAKLNRHLSRLTNIPIFRKITLNPLFFIHFFSPGRSVCFFFFLSPRFLKRCEFFALYEFSCRVWCCTESSSCTRG